MGGALLAILLVLFYLLLIGYSVAAYVLQGLALQTVARRRGIDKPYFAWIPVANMWLLGCISDQYQYALRGVDRNYRKKLMWLMIATLIGLVPLYIFEFATIFATEMGAAEGIVVILSMLLIVVSFAVIAVSVVASVFQYIAIYDFFRSCRPQKAVLYLVLSIVVSVVYPVFVFMVRNSDEGMPGKSGTAQLEGSAE